MRILPKNTVIYLYKGEKLNIKDALTISLIGITVVFIGLILTSLLIYSFSLFRKSKKKDGKAQKKEKLNETIQLTEKEISPEIMAVISTVVEIEIRLYQALRGTKFTFDSTSQRGWSEEGKLIVTPFEGGKIK